MIDYVGDLSRRDAELLLALAGKADRILEFGAGASTQIFAAYGRGTVDSVETDPVWIGNTQRNLARIELSSSAVAFHNYTEFVAACASGIAAFDLCFVDGADALRLDFALMTWPALKVGGKMLFHDTRRTKPHGDSPTSDVENVCILIARFSPEIDRVVMNQADSNISIITKREPLLLQDWNAVEHRTNEQIGIA